MAYSILIGKPEVKGPLGWEDIRMGLREVGAVIVQLV
jgi:hypothetical protein